MERLARGPFTDSPVPAMHRKARLKILLPKEHGAWATLFVPLFIGLGVAGIWDVKAVLLLGAIFFLYLARYPLVLWAKADFKKFPANGIPTLLFAMGHGLFLAALLIFRYHLWLLVPLGLGVLVLLFIHLWLVKRRMERTAPGDFLGVVALTSAAPAAFYAASGSMTNIAFLLWLLCALFFGGPVFYVKMQFARRSAGIPGEKGRSKFGIGLIFYLVAALGAVILLSFMDYLPQLTVVAFIPLAVWMLTGIFRRQGQFNIKRLGFTLVGHSIAFGVILAFSFLV